MQVEDSYEVPAISPQRTTMSKEFAKFEDLQRELFELDLRIRACTEDTPEDTSDVTVNFKPLLKPYQNSRKFTLVLDVSMFKIKITSQVFMVDIIAEVKDYLDLVKISGSVHIY